MAPVSWQDEMTVATGDAALDALGAGGPMAQALDFVESTYGVTVVVATFDDRNGGYVTRSALVRCLEAGAPEFVALVMYPNRNMPVIYEPTVAWKWEQQSADPEDHGYAQRNYAPDGEVWTWGPITARWDVGRYTVIRYGHGWSFEASKGRYVGPDERADSFTCYVDGERRSANSWYSLEEALLHGMMVAAERDAGQKHSNADRGVSFIARGMGLR